MHLIRQDSGQEAKLAVCMFDASRRSGFTMTFQRAGPDGAPITLVGEFRSGTTYRTTTFCQAHVLFSQHLGLPGCWMCDL